MNTVSSPGSSSNRLTKDFCLSGTDDNQEKLSKQELSCLLMKTILLEGSLSPTRPVFVLGTVNIRGCLIKYQANGSITPVLSTLTGYDSSRDQAEVFLITSSMTRTEPGSLTMQSMDTTD